jgi:hypothetical protein
MALAALGSGCLGDDEQPPLAQGAPREIAQVVERLERAAARGDWAAVCRDLLTRAARRRVGGPDCLRLTREAGEQIERPAIEITSIRVRGDSAQVGVRTRARGQAEVTDMLELRREGGAWRVEALGARPG